MQFYMLEFDFTEQCRKYDVNFILQLITSAIEIVLAGRLRNIGQPLACLHVEYVFYCILGLVGICVNLSQIVYIIHHMQQ